jgi:hypothetical protein
MHLKHLGTGWPEAYKDGTSVRFRPSRLTRRGSEGVFVYPNLKVSLHPSSHHFNEKKLRPRQRIKGSRTRPTTVRGQAGAQPGELKEEHHEEDR